VDRPVRDLTKRNIRTLWALRRLAPWNLAQSTVAVEQLERQYAEHVSKLLLQELPARPRFVFCATDMSFGINWVSERSRIGSYLAGYVSPPPDWSLARAIAASSCFPPVFDPLPLTGIDPERFKGGRATRSEERDALIKGLRLTDGGVYDNMGLEPVWKDTRTVLVSDGGAPFDFEPDAGFFARLGRYQSIVSRQAGAVRKRWLIANFEQDEMDGTYWRIGGAPTTYEKGAPGYSKDLARNKIATIRTDLDYFTDAEAGALQNHGYLLVDAALRSHAPALLPATMPALNVPDKKWMDENKVEAALDESGHRKVLGRWGWFAH
jgi:NTE family protein